MKLLFDKSLRDWAFDYYIDFHYIEFNICKDKRIITLSEYEVLTTGEDAYACMYSFYKYSKKEGYSYISYNNGQSKEYKELFPNSENRESRERICRVKTKDFVGYLRENISDFYEIDIHNDTFLINGNIIESLN